MRTLLILLTTLAAAAVMATTGNAWHATDVVVSVKCNPQTGVYDITALIVQSQDWPGAFVKSVTPSSYPGSTAGSKTVVVVVAWAASSETQTFTRYVTLDGKCVPQVFCPADTVQIGSSPLVCLKTVTNTVERPAPPAPPAETRTETITNTVTNTVTTQGKPTPPPPCVKPHVPKGAHVVKGKGCNYYITLKQKVRVKLIKSKPIHDRCEPPPDDPGCEGKCDWPKKYGGNG